MEGGEGGRADDAAGGDGVRTFGGGCLVRVFNVEQTCVCAGAWEGAAGPPEQACHYRIIWPDPYSTFLTPKASGGDAAPGICCRGFCGASSLARLWRG